MVSTTPNTIELKTSDESFQQDDGEADGTISPGDLIDLTGIGSSGATDEKLFQRNSTDGAVLVPRIATELGKTGLTTDDDYADGDYLEYRTFEVGEEALVRIFDGTNAGATGTDTSDNANISAGDYLVPYSGGGTDGTFRAYDSGDGDTEGLKMFQALESVDNSSGSSPAFIRAKKV